MTGSSPFPRSAALVAGFGLLIMAALGPFGLFTITAIDTAPTPDTALALAQSPRFTAAIAAFLAIAALDVAVAVGLNGVFRPAAPSLSRLAMWLRIVYALALAVLAIYLVLARLATDGVAAQGYVSAFSRGWLLSLGVFGLHLVAVAAAGLRAPYLPAFIAWLIGLAGLGYVADALGTFLVPGYALNLAAYVFIGEIVLMVWLIFRAVRPPRAATQ